MYDLEEITLGECVELVIDHRGKTPAKLGGDWVESGIRVISAANVHNGRIDNQDQIRCVSEEIYKKWMSEDVCRNDCFIASEGASLGENCIWDSDEKIVLGQRLYAIRTNPDKLDPWYFAAYMQTKRFRMQIDQISTGSTVFGVSQPVLMGVKLLLPSISVQRKVGEYYKLIKNKIENNNAICRELEFIAKATFDYWFLQYDFPNSFGKPYRASGGKMKWSDKLKCDIPSDWEIKSLADVVKESKNGDWGNDLPDADDDIRINCFRGADFPSITEEYMMTAPVRYIKEKNSDRILCDGDLVTEISGGSPTQSTGRIGYITSDFLNRTENKMTCSNFCKAFTPIKKEYQFWLYQIWKYYYDNGAMFNFESKTTGIKNFMFDEFLKNIFVAVPDENLLDRYQQLCGLYFNAIQKRMKQNQELSSIRDYLLPMLMNGQVVFE